jgi:hypothetical protein
LRVKPDLVFVLVQPPLPRSKLQYSTHYSHPTSLPFEFVIVVLSRRSIADIERPLSNPRVLANQGFATNLALICQPHGLSFIVPFFDRRRIVSQPRTSFTNHCPLEAHRPLTAVQQTFVNYLPRLQTVDHDGFFCCLE